MSLGGLSRELWSLARYLALRFSNNLRGAIVYRGACWMQVFGTVITNVTMLVFWWLALARFGASFGVRGIGMATVAAVWALASTSFGFATLFLNGLLSFAPSIVEGRLDPYLLYPRDPYAMVAFSSTAVSALGDVLYGYALFAIFVSSGPGRMLLFTISAISAAVFFAAFLSLLNSLTFWIGNSTDLVGVAWGAYVSFELYPESLFSPGVKALLLSLVPVGLGFWGPARVIQVFDWGWLGWSLAASAGALGASYVVFRAGLRRYASGNAFYSA